jgi:hypothetical protein
MYVYCPTWVRGDSAAYNAEKNLSTLVTRLEKGDRTLLSQLFDIRYPYWKRNLLRNLRLLGQLRYLGEVPVLVLFALWLRGSHEYHYFLKQRQNPDYQKWVKGLVPDDVLQVWLAQRQQEHSQNLLPALPEALFAWTQFLNASHPKERLVLESGEWVRQGQALTVVQRRQAYQAVIQLVDDEEGRLYQQLPSFYQGAEIRCWQEGSLHLAVSLVQVREYQGKRFPFLIGIYDHAPEQKERFALGRQTRLFGIGTDQPDILRHPQPLEVWKQYSYRAYPDYMVADETIWLEMQETKEGNLALSMEEEAVLQSRSMPLLINGRAGSGKSLMLYYRFAEYCSHYLKTARQESPQYHPLFLTYSPALVQQAWEKVSVILRVSHRYRQDERSFSPAEIQQCRAFFSTFQDYLFRCLPTERQEHYQPDKYVNFYQFQSWYRGRRDVELAWHTIRTLIKGYEVSDYLDPDSYRELPEADRSVDIAVFDQIYSELWPGYLERTTHEGYWDDQDLVRDVLKNGTINPIHPVIFCDEVQDFTQIELNVIFCLSPWGKYKLDWAIERLPYAFAGDPLQTINPTGFRWAALKKYLHEHIHAYLLPGHPFEIQDPQELKNNYRSVPQITRFSNVVNLWRRILSNNREITPQLPWRPQEQGRSVQKFVLDGQGQNLTDGELKNMLSTSTGTVCILPCCVGEELSYVAQDPKLQKIFAEELAQNLKPAQLQTVTAVKGMEFKKIILYKFGDYYQQNFKKQLKHYAQGTENQVSLQLQYFLNQLYVGITRPIEALAIMDTSCGWQKFWEPNLATDFWLNHPSLKQDQSQWQTHPPVLNSTTQSMGIQYWTDTNLQEVLSLALEFLKRGVAEGNLNFLEDARTFARQAEDWRLEQECQTWLLKLQPDYISAGHQFLNLEKSALPDKNPKREAWECFWRAEAWSELQQYRETFDGCPDIPDYSPLVELMLDIRNKATKPSRFDKLVRVRDWLSVEISPKNADGTWKTWKSCVQKFLTEFQHMLNDLKAYCPEEEARKRFLQQTYEAWVGHLAFLGQRQPFVEQYHNILVSVGRQLLKLAESAPPDKNLKMILVRVGHQFLKLEKSALPDKNLKREAWECFWRAEAWSELQQHHTTFAGCPDIPNYSPLVKLMLIIRDKVAKPSTRRQQLVDVRDWLSVKISPKNVDGTWKSCVQEFLTEFQRVLNDLKAYCPEEEARKRFLQQTYEAWVGHLAFLGQRQPFAEQYHNILVSVGRQLLKLAESAPPDKNLKMILVRVGHQFLKLEKSALPDKNLKREAWECFWRAEAWSELQQHHTTFDGCPDIPNYSPLVKLMLIIRDKVAKPSTRLQQLVRVRDWLRVEISPKNVDGTWKTWKSCVQEFLTEFQRVLNDLEAYCPEEEARKRFLQQTYEAWMGHLAFLGQQQPFVEQYHNILVLASHYLALELLRCGVAGRNLNFLEDARTFARQAEDWRLEQECQAWLLKLKPDYISAGHQFLKFEKSALPDKNPKREAWECFWRAEAWSELQQHHATFTSCRDIPDYSPLVKRMLIICNKATKPSMRFRQLVRVRDWLNVEVSPQNADVTWKPCVKKFLTEFQRVLNDLKAYCPEEEARKQFLQETYEAWVGHLAFLGQQEPFVEQYHNILVSVGHQFLKLEELALPDKNLKREVWECFWRAKAWSELQQYRATFDDCPDIPNYSPLVALMLDIRNKAAKPSRFDKLVRVREMLDIRNKAAKLSRFDKLIRVRDWLRVEISPKNADGTWKTCVQEFLTEFQHMLNDLETYCPEKGARKRFLQQTYEAWVGHLAFLGQQEPFVEQYHNILVWLGHQFLKLEELALPDKNLKREVWECFWRAEAWSELQQYRETFDDCPDIPNYSPLVALMLDIRNKAAKLSRFDKLVQVRDWLRVEISPKNADGTWKTCVQEFLTEFQHMLNDLEAYCPEEEARKRFLQQTYEAWVGHLAFLGQQEPFAEQYHNILVWLGHQFLKLEELALPDKNLKREVWECFWRAEAWSELQQYRETFDDCPDIPNYSPLVALMLDIRNKAAKLSRFDKLVQVRDWLRVEISPKNADGTWKTCVQEFLTEFQHMLNDLEAYCPEEEARKRFLQQTYEAWVGHLAFLGQQEPFAEQYRMIFGNLSQRRNSPGT